MYLRLSVLYGLLMREVVVPSDAERVLDCVKRLSVINRMIAKLKWSLVGEDARATITELKCRRLAALDELEKVRPQLAAEIRRSFEEEVDDGEKSANEN
jgi:uncharacterized protein YcbX